MARLEIYGVIGLLIVGLVVGNYFYVKHLQAKVAGLEEKVAGLELKADIVKKAQEATDQTVKAMQARRKVNVQDNAKIDSVVESMDNAAMDTLWINNGMLNPKANSPLGRPPGNSRNISP